MSLVVAAHTSNPRRNLGLGNTLFTLDANNRPWTDAGRRLLGEAIDGDGEVQRGATFHTLREIGGGNGA
jgi:hypothetical protein